MPGIGILGTNFGKRHAEIFRDLVDTDVIGIAGRDPEKTR
jgi:predicted dehydrogenase